MAIAKLLEIFICVIVLIVILVMIYHCWINMIVNYCMGLYKAHNLNKIVLYLYQIKTNL